MSVAAPTVVPSYGMLLDRENKVIGLIKNSHPSLLPFLASSTRGFVQHEKRRKDTHDSPVCSFPLFTFLYAVIGVNTSSVPLMCSLRFAKLKLYAYFCLTCINSAVIAQSTT